MQMTDVASQRPIAETTTGATAASRAGGARPGTHSERVAGQSRWWQDALRRRMLAAADLTAVAAATLLAIIPTSGTLWPLAFLPVWILIAKLFGLYDRDHRALRHLTADEVPAIAAWTAVNAGLLALLMQATPAEDIGPLQVAAFFSVATAGAIGLRSLARWGWWRRTPPELVALIGDAGPLISLRRKFEVFRDMHFDLAEERLTEEIGIAEVRTERLGDLCDRVDRIVVAATGVETELIGELKELCRRRQVKLSVVSPLRGQALPSESFSQLADLPILEYNTWDPSRSTLLIKRIFDVAVAGFGLLLLAPFLAAIAIAIKLDSPGPVMFSQIRAGLGGRPFRMYKFRTMGVDAEARLDRLVDLGDLDEPVFKLRDDPRVTRVGRALRRLSLDELPQLFNVLFGEMSIVGPRPEQVELVERYAPEHRAKLSVKPGVTGPMQVFGRGELSFEERLAVELEYADNYSLMRDARILLHTLPAVVRGTGAF